MFALLSAALAQCESGRLVKEFAVAHYSPWCCSGESYVWAADLTPGLIAEMQGSYVTVAPQTDTSIELPMSEYLIDKGMVLNLQEYYLDADYHETWPGAHKDFGSEPVGSVSWCEGQAHLLNVTFSVQASSPGAPAGCTKYNDGRVVFVETCTDHVNCNTATCNGCTLLAVSAEMYAYVHLKYTTVCAENDFVKTANTAIDQDGFDILGDQKHYDDYGPESDFLILPEDDAYGNTGGRRASEVSTPTLVEQCARLCGAHTGCAGFVHNYDEAPPYCVFKASTTNPEYALVKDLWEKPLGCHVFPTDYPPNEPKVRGTNYSIGANGNQGIYDTYASQSGPALFRLYANECNFPPSNPPPPPIIGAMCSEGYWPLYMSVAEAEEVSPDNTSHTHAFHGVTYHMPGAFVGAKHGDTDVGCPWYTRGLPPNTPPLPPSPPPPEMPPSPPAPPAPPPPYQLPVSLQVVFFTIFPASLLLCGVVVCLSWHLYYGTKRGDKEKVPQKQQQQNAGAQRKGFFKIDNI